MSLSVYIFTLYPLQGYIDEIIENNQWFTQRNSCFGQMDNLDTWSK